MPKSKKKKAQLSAKRARKARRVAAGGQSKYAIKHRGGGNTGPHGMWIRVGS